MRERAETDARSLLGQSAWLSMDWDTVKEFFEKGKAILAKFSSSSHRLRLRAESGSRRDGMSGMQSSLTRVLSSRFQGCSLEKRRSL